MPVKPFHWLQHDISRILHAACACSLLSTSVCSGARPHKPASSCPHLSAAPPMCGQPCASTSLSPHTTALTVGGRKGEKEGEAAWRKKKASGSGRKSLAFRNRASPPSFSCSKASLHGVNSSCNSSLRPQCNSGTGHWCLSPWRACGARAARCPDTLVCTPAGSVRGLGLTRDPEVFAAWCPPSPWALLPPTHLVVSQEAVHIHGILPACRCRMWDHG